MNHNWEYDYSNLYPNGANDTGAANGADAAGGRDAAAGAGGAGLPYTEQRGMSAAPGMPPVQSPASQKKKGGTARRIAACAALVAVCGAAGFGGGYWGGVLARGQAPSGPEISAKAGPSVVEVTTEAVTTNRFFGEYVESGAGSGVIISQDGYLVTNHHVVNGATQIRVRLNDGTEYEASVVGSDSKTDVAVLKIEAEGLSPAIVGDSDSLQVGEFVLAVGNPLGRLGGTVTDGIISALDRDVTVNNQSMQLLQMNAAVSPGNSGGGLFNARGELIGIVNAKSSDSDAEGLGFAIPINTAIRVAEELISNGYVTGRPAMGVMVIDINNTQTAYQYGVNQAGVYVQSVNENGPAERAGLAPGDRFIGIDGTAVGSTSDITGILGEHAVGDTIEVQVVRGGQILTVSLTLEESQPQPDPVITEG